MQGPPLPSHYSPLAFLELELRASLLGSLPNPGVSLQPLVGASGAAPCLNLVACTSTLVLLGQSSGGNLGSWPHRQPPVPAGTARLMAGLRGDSRLYGPRTLSVPTCGEGPGAQPMQFSSQSHKPVAHSRALLVGAGLQEGVGATAHRVSARPH